MQPVDLAAAAVTVERGSAEGQWLTWLERISADGPSTDPEALEIWGYTDQPSYAPGETVGLHVSTSAPIWGFEVWRDGHTFEKVHEQRGLAGAHHPVGDDVVASGCGWPQGASFEIPTGWASGGYIVVLRGERDGQEVTQDAFFVLRAAEPGRGSKLAMVAATYTWQEYNDWGGGCGYFSDEYVDHTADPLEVREKSFKPRLSFDRPWSRGLIRTPVGVPRLAQPPPPVGAAVGIPAADWAISNGYSVWTVAAGWARYDALTFRWLEANGYEPELLSQWDLDRDPTVLDGYRAVVTTGHDEYWSAGGRAVLDQFIEGGGRYARLGGNIVWQVRMEDGLHTQVCHKYAAHADPEHQSDDIDRRTGAFEAHYIDRPPVTTFGANGFRGVYSRMGGLSPRGAGGFIVYRPGHWAFDGADVYYGDVLGSDLPVVGYETDGVAYTFRHGLPYPTGDDGAPEGLEILALTPVTLEEEDHGQAGNLISIADGDLAFAAEALFGEDTPEARDRIRYGSAVITAMAKGSGEVFCAGTTEWCHALAQGDIQVEAITRNVLNRFLD
ncbi:MAG: hypothetical protein F4126_06775 [Acidimicrobiaceae bacterium]|nr:hypothetical protein [Acidimicrobiaceae bacterium]MYH93406.1 hypothetical protein [Acidimicrobiaceae bacterium]